MNMTNDELKYLEEMINEEILKYLYSWYSKDDEYIVALRNILKKLDLKELYNFNDYNK